MAKAKLVVKEVPVVKTVIEKEENVVLTMTKDEAEYLRQLLGATSASQREDIIRRYYGKFPYPIIGDLGTAIFGALSGVK